jgi:hypothetical protein
MRPGGAERVDGEYARNGTANLFVAPERSGNRRLPRDPLAGWRHAAVTDRRTRTDFAPFVRDLADGPRDRDAGRVALVMDNLNTHTAGSLYEAFPPAEAERVADRLGIHYTPRHGSWLNMAEVELSVLARQCLSERMEDKAAVAREVAAWEADRNQRKVGIDGRFTTADARIKLKRLYPAAHG